MTTTQTIPVGTTVRVEGDDPEHFTGTVVRLDPDVFDVFPGPGEVAVASVHSTWPVIVRVADCRVVAS